MIVIIHVLLAFKLEWGYTQRNPSLIILQIATGPVSAPCATLTALTERAHAKILAPCAYCNANDGASAKSSRGWAWVDEW